ncbi:MAG: tetratricopeptide repeat protein [Pseudomonadota bacterium]
MGVAIPQLVSSSPSSSPDGEAHDFYVSMNIEDLGKGLFAPEQARPTDFPFEEREQEAIRLREEGDFAGAIVCYKGMIKQLKTGGQDWRDTADFFDLQIAITHAEAENPKAAVKACDRLIKSKTISESLRKTLHIVRGMLLLVKMKKPKAGLKSLDRALSSGIFHNFERILIYIHKAFALYVLGQSAESLKVMMQTHSIKGLTPTEKAFVLNTTGMFVLEQEQFDLSYDWFQEALKLEGVNVYLKAHIFMSAAEWHRKRGASQEHLLEIEKYCTSAIDLNTLDERTLGQAFRWRAEARHGTGIFRKAIDDCTRILELSNQPKQRTVFALQIRQLSLREVYDQEENTDQDFALIKQALLDICTLIEMADNKFSSNLAKMDDNTFQLYHDRGYLLDFIGRYDEAEEAFDRALHISEIRGVPYTYSYFYKALLLDDKDDRAGALAQLETAANLNGLIDDDRSLCMIKAAELQKKYGMIDDAIARYTETLNLSCEVRDANRARALAGRGLCLHHKGDLRAARNDWEEAVRLDPDSVYLADVLPFFEQLDPEHRTKSLQKLPKTGDTEIMDNPSGDSDSIDLSQAVEEAASPPLTLAGTRSDLIVHEIREYASNVAGKNRQADLEFVAQVTRELRNNPPADIEERREIKDALNKELLKPFRIRVRSQGVGCMFSVAADGTFQLRGSNPKTGKSTSFAFVKADLAVGPWIGKYPDEAELELKPVHV